MSENYKEEFVKYYGVLHVLGESVTETLCGKVHTGNFIKMYPADALKEKHCTTCFEDYKDMEKGKDNVKSAKPDKRNTPMATW